MGVTNSKGLVKENPCHDNEAFYPYGSAREVCFLRIVIPFSPPERLLCISIVLVVVMLLMMMMYYVANVLQY